ncbi:MAG: LuxR C-terminal-related transcriptional regulator [Myxococcota bacterium]
MSKPLLTPRQLEVLEAVAGGLTNRDIARVLGISLSTAKAHVSAVLKALDVTNRTEAIGLLARLGLVDGRGGGGERAVSARPRSFPGFGDRPAIAVLPFEDLRGDAEPDIVVDGLVNDLINGLAAFRWFPVISRTSTFHYRSYPVAWQDVSRELGARYLVEGSARSSARRLRLQVQLIDAVDGYQVWASRFDRDIDDVLGVQDAIAESIVGALAPTLLQVEGFRALRAGGGSVGSWEHFQRGMVKLYRQAPEEVRESIGCFEAAIEMDGDFAPAHAGLSIAFVVDGLQTVGVTRYEGGTELEGALSRAVERFGRAASSGRRAVALDPMDPIGHLGLGMSLVFVGDVGPGLASVERAIELNPSLAFTCWGYGNALMWSERWRKAPEWYLRAIRLSPRDPYLHHFHGDLAAAYLRAGDDVAAAEHATRAVDLQPAADPFTHRPVLIASLAGQGRRDAARRALARLERETPHFNLEIDRLLLPEDLFERIARGLAEAGWQA